MKPVSFFELQPPTRFSQPKSAVHDAGGVQALEERKVKEWYLQSANVPDAPGCAHMSRTMAGHILPDIGPKQVCVCIYNICTMYMHICVCAYLHPWRI